VNPDVLILVLMSMTGALGLVLGSLVAIMARPRVIKSIA
jgi:hypothetical protein